MSFADGLLHERQDEDGKTREHVRYTISRLKSALAGDLHLPSSGSPTLRDAIKYLEAYADGDHLI